MAQKIFVLDTNVLVHDPHAMYSFDDNIVAIPLIVLQEMDRFKGENTPRGKSTRQAIRNLDELRARGSLKDGVKLDSEGMVKIVLSQQAEWGDVLDESIEADNEILQVALNLKKDGGMLVRLISKDINMRVRADALGLEVEDYEKDVVNEEAVYKGWEFFPVPAISLRKTIPEQLVDAALAGQFILNEYIVVHSDANEENYKILRYKGGKDFVPVEQPRLAWPIDGRNIQQIMAFDALLDPEIQFLTLIGGAGTGKTFLALVAGLHEVLMRHSYERLLVTRPVIPLGADIGYLPGDVHEKLHSWMQPIYDNMEFIVHLANKGVEYQDHHEEQGPDRDDQSRHRSKKGHMRQDQQQKAALPPLDILVRRGKVSLEAITYMRGRSIPYQYILIDEVQNLTPHEVKTLVTRVGEGSKIILAGDPYQIDSPYLDFSSNGLVVASEKFKGQPFFSTVFLKSSERSLLSQKAGELL